MRGALEETCCLQCWVSGCVTTPSLRGSERMPSSLGAAHPLPRGPHQPGPVTRGRPTALGFTASLPSNRPRTHSRPRGWGLRRCRTPRWQGCSCRPGHPCTCWSLSSSSPARPAGRRWEVSAAPHCTLSPLAQGAGKARPAPRLPLPLSRYSQSQISFVKYMPWLMFNIRAPCQKLINVTKHVDSLPLNATIGSHLIQCPH